jgi:hypothetical protein
MIVEFFDIGFHRKFDGGRRTRYSSVAMLQAQHQPDLKDEPA